MTKEKFLEITKIGKILQFTKYLIFKYNLYLLYSTISNSVSYL